MAASIIPSTPTSSSSLCGLATSWPYPKIVLHALLVAIAAVGALCLLHGVVWPSASMNWIVRENGALENTQAFILASTFVVGLVAMYRAEISCWRTIAIAISCVALAGWAREIQSTSSVPLTDGGLVGFSLDRSVKHSLMGISVMVAIGRAMTAWVRYPADRSLWLSPRFIWPIAPFVSCFVLAEACEELHWVLIEETIEIMAYSMLLLCSVWIAGKPSTR